MKQLESRRVLITGSARGIGAATARIAVREGAEVILHGREESDHLKALATDLGCKSLAFDITDREAVHRVVGQEIEAGGTIDALVNCAGWVHRRPFLETEADDWNVEFSANLLGLAWVCQAVIPAMLDKGYGRIVNVASMRGHEVTASYQGAAYSASKAAVINLTASLAKEFSPAVNVNAVSPGFIQTDMSNGWPPEIWAETEKALVQRVGQPEEVGNLLVFLASEGASFITGQTILADGGYTLR